MKLDVIPLVGGLDLVTTPILVKPGSLLSATNFEPDINGGYKRMAGFERYDGRTKPSSASYYICDVELVDTISVGDTITGATSGATALVIAVPDATSLVVTKYTGTFVSENIEVSAVNKGVINAISENAASSGVLHATYKNLAADAYRGDIVAPTGSGPVRGVWHYKGDEYCFRDNAGATACDMWKATSSGWQQITFGRELQFTGAVGEIFEGDTITGATSGASGVVRRSLLRTGTWAASGVGTLVFDSVTSGPFQNGENLQVAAVTKAVADGADSAITLQPGGRFTFDNYNFTGSTDTLRMYMADGVNYLHEFDGTRLVPIRTGIGNDKPKYVRGQKNHLFCAIQSSVQNSSIGDPYGWNAATGASEIALGETVTGILPQTGDSSTGVLVITTEHKVYILYGNDSSDFNLVLHSPETGAKPYTLQNIGYAHFLDTKGITQLMTSQAFGGFEMSIMSKLVLPIIDEKRGLEVASCIVRKSNQYRVFFNDGTGLIMQVTPGQGGTKSAALMFFDYGDIYMNNVCSFVDTDGTERIIAGGSDGMVYELDKGTSFDGEAIPYHFFMVFNHSKSVRMRKRYRRTVLQFKAGNTARISVGYDLSYGNLDPGYGSAVSMSQVMAKTVNNAGGFWDNFNWDSFTWDSSYMQEINVNTPGTGESIAILVAGENDEDEPFTIHTALIHYLDGRQNR